MCECGGGVEEERKHEVSGGRIGGGCECDVEFAEGMFGMIEMYTVDIECGVCCVTAEEVRGGEEVYVWKREG